MTELEPLEIVAIIYLCFTGAIILTILTAILFIKFKPSANWNCNLSCGRNPCLLYCLFSTLSIAFTLGMLSGKE